MQYVSGCLCSYIHYTAECFDALYDGNRFKNVLTGIRYVLHRLQFNMHILSVRGVLIAVEFDAVKCCHTIGCESHQPKFGVLCTPSHGVTVSWCAQHTNLGVLCTPIWACYAHQFGCAMHTNCS